MALYWQWKTKESKKKLSQCRFVYHNSHLGCMGLNLNAHGDRVLTDHWVSTAHDSNILLLSWQILLWLLLAPFTSLLTVSQFHCLHPNCGKVILLYLCSYVYLPYYMAPHPKTTNLILKASTVKISRTMVCVCRYRLRSLFHQSAGELYRWSSVTRTCWNCLCWGVRQLTWRNNTTGSPAVKSIHHLI